MDAALLQQFQMSLSAAQQCGISHNDVVARNVCANASGHVRIIDSANASICRDTAVLRQGVESTFRLVNRDRPLRTPKACVQCSGRASQVYKKTTRFQQLQQAAPCLLVV